jgi:methionyl-tRNA formyltransferase
VFTHADDANENIWFGSVASLAREHGIETLIVEDANQPEHLARVAALAPDFIFSFYYRRMLPVKLLSCARRGAYNMHGSLLPKFRGRAPVNWAVLHGETETGATLHEMVEKPDAGRIAGQHAVPIGIDDTAAQVFNRVTDAAEIVLRKALPGLIDGSLRLRAQDLKAGSYFGGRKPEDGRIDWRRAARDIHNLVRAVAPPYPPAFTGIGGVRVEIHRTRLVGTPADAPDVRATDTPAGINPPAPMATLSATPGTAAAARIICTDGGALDVLAGRIGDAPFTAAEFLSRFGPDPVSLKAS